MFNKISAFFMSAVSLFCWIFGIPFYAVGKTVDMDKFELVWSDEFDGDAVDESVWSGHYVWGGTEIRKGGYWNKKMASVENGCLTIKTRYIEEGIDGAPGGYYSYGLDTQNSYEQKYGYFEVRCKLPKGKGIWAAFWMLSEGTYDTADKGVTGAELDIFESPYFGEKRQNKVSSNIHIDGYGEAHQSLGAKKFLVEGDPYSEFNTYGLEWNEKEYTFYINGKKSFSTKWGGVCAVPEFLILSVETSGKDGKASDSVSLDGVESDYVVDYVRAYQYK